jgi:predicted MFS family arabinose efflux permease
VVFSGLYVLHSYAAAVFGRATAGDGTRLATLLFFWGGAAVLGTVVAGRLTDRLGSRLTVNAVLIVLAVDLALLPWTARNLATAAVAMVLLGVGGWGLNLANLHRLVGIRPAESAVATALNSASIYLAASLAGLAGGVILAVLGATWLGPAVAVVMLAGLVVAERAHRAIEDCARRQPVYADRQRPATDARTAWRHE